MLVTTHWSFFWLLWASYYGKIKYLTSNELEEIRGVLNDRTCGTNIIYCENSKKPPILSSVYKNRVELSTDSPEYYKERLFLSVSPAHDSINIANQIHFINHSVGNMSSTVLNVIAPTYENGSSSYLILERFPTKHNPLWGLYRLTHFGIVKSKGKR